MKVKLLALAVMVALSGCASKPTPFKADKDPTAEVNKPKPVSSVFNRPEGPMVIEFTDDGEFVAISAKASAPIAGNNAFSIEQATQVATLRARRNIAEFIAKQVSSTRTLKVLSHTVQKSKENTANGMVEETQVDDRAFDTNGEFRSYPLADGEVVSGPATTKFDNNNVNAERIAQSVRENILTSSVVLLRGTYVTEEKIDAAGRTISVTVRTSKNSISAADNLRKMMEGSGK